MMKSTLLLAVATLILGPSWFSIASADDAWRRSYLLEEEGKYEAAAEAIEQFLKEVPTNEFAQLRSGWLYYQAGNYSRSVTHYQTAKEINSRSIAAMLGLSLPLMKQERWREVAAVTREVIKLSSWNYYAHIRLLAAEDSLQQWDSLKQHAETLKAYYPSDATVLVYLARAYHHTGNDAQAREVYQQVLQRYPDHLESNRFLAR